MGLLNSSVEEEERKSLANPVVVAVAQRIHFVLIRKDSKSDFEYPWPLPP